MLIGPSERFIFITCVHASEQDYVVGLVYILVGRWSWVCHPYIESATALSDIFVPHHVTAN